MSLITSLMADISRIFSNEKIKEITEFSNSENNAGLIKKLGNALGLSKVFLLAVYLTCPFPLSFPTFLLLITK